MDLTEGNFLLFAAKHYDTMRSTGEEEFQEDLKRFQYLRRLFKRYADTDDLQLRLILNHIIIIYNCFGHEATSMLFMRLSEYKDFVKPFAVFLNYMPNTIKFNETTIRSSDIAMDQRIITELRKL